MLDGVYNNVNGIGSAITFKNLMTSTKVLNDNPAPLDSNRSVLLNTNDNVDRWTPLAVCSRSTAIRSSTKRARWAALVVSTSTKTR